MFIFIFTHTRTHTLLHARALSRLITRVMMIYDLIIIIMAVTYQSRLALTVIITPHVYHNDDIMILMNSQRWRCQRKKNQIKKTKYYDNGTLNILFNEIYFYIIRFIIGTTVLILFSLLPIINCYKIIVCWSNFKCKYCFETESNPYLLITSIRTRSLYKTLKYHLKQSTKKTYINYKKKT